MDYQRITFEADMKSAPASVIWTSVATAGVCNSGLPTM